MPDQLPDVVGGSGPHEARPVVAVGYPSSVNFTTVVLGPGETWEGEFETNMLEDILLNVASDQPGSLRMDISPDGGSTILFSPVFPVKASTYDSDGRASRPLFRAFRKGAGRSIRLSYTNGSTQQGRFIVFCSFGNNLYPYSSSNTGAMLVTTREEDLNVAVSVSADMTTNSTRWEVVLDLNDGVYGHDPFSDMIAVSKLIMTVDKTSNGRGSFLLGVVTRIGDTNADVSFFGGIPFNNSDDQRLKLDRDYPPLLLTYVDESGDTPKMTPSSVETGIAELNSLTSIPSSRGDRVPEKGDIVARWVLTAGSFFGFSQIFAHGRDYYG